LWGKGGLCSHEKFLLPHQHPIVHKTTNTTDFSVQATGSGHRSKLQEETKTTPPNTNKLSQHHRNNNRNDLTKEKPTKSWKHSSLHSRENLAEDLRKKKITHEECQKQLADLDNRQMSIVVNKERNDFRFKKQKKEREIQKNSTCVGGCATLGD
jgi:hypothetical protein